MKKILRIQEIPFFIGGRRGVAIFKRRYCKPNARYIKNYNKGMEKAKTVCEELCENEDIIIQIDGFTGYVSEPAPFEYNKKALKDCLQPDEADCVILIRAEGQSIRSKSQRSKFDEIFEVIKRELKLYNKQKRN